MIEDILFFGLCIGALVWFEVITGYFRGKD